MMLLERWVVATVLGLGMPLVSTAAVSSALQQAGNAQTSQDRAKAPDSQDPQAAKDDDQDEKPGISAYDRDTPPEDQTPEKAVDQDAKSANTAHDRDTQPAKGSEDQNPSQAGNNQDVKPAKVAQDHQAQPNKSRDGQNQAKVAGPSVPPVPPSPATPEQAKQQQLEKDSATLLQLVQELKVEVEKAGSNTLSLAAVRKADEIQRLAKNLKERMREQGQMSQNKP